MSNQTHTPTTISDQDLAEFEAITAELHDLQERMADAAARRAAVTKGMTATASYREVSDATGLAVSRIYYIARENEGRKR